MDFGILKIKIVNQKVITINYQVKIKNKLNIKYKY